MSTRSLYADATVAAPPSYALPVPAGARRALAAGWLGLALAALVGSGLFSILLWAGVVLAGRMTAYTLY